ncbi:transglutaminase domain-containing protein [Aeoliella sp.]|uniref:transglutaminase domain-containing protein n=1 Tax=Aeoliella sp. TaxID=2795800 RepID=UPI003CCBFC0E
MHHAAARCVCFFLFLLTTKALVASPLEEQLALAGDNAGQLQQALDKVADDQRAGMEFLIANMPERDLQSLSSEYLLENVTLAYRAWREAPWHEEVSEPLFLNNVLPYASINERRDRWRAKFFEKLQPLVKDAKKPGEAAAILNNEIFKLFEVRYSTKRAKADQSPFESMESGLASCTGLSVLLIDACRAVGVPARFVGTPLWSDQSGNHSWVEVWDEGWHFTGAAEPAGMDLDKGWFIARAARAERDNPRHAIYATSFKRTPLQFPCVWRRGVDYVKAVNVTERYVADKTELPAGHGYARFRVLGEKGERVSCDLKLVDAEGDVCFEGMTRDERFDGNDHLTAVLAKGQQFAATAVHDGQKVTQQVTLEADEQLITIDLSQAPVDPEAGAADDPIAGLKSYLAKPGKERGDIAEQAFSNVALTRQQADEASELLWSDHVERIKQERAAEMEARVLEEGDLKMPFFYTTYGDKPEGGRSLYISMHGGGGAPARVNDQQWKNQQKLYEPPEGVYVAPRAPTNTWNLWHQKHIDRMFGRLIENLIVFEDVDPNRVYLMGYSAGGDGAYRLAPRMADRWAAVSMMAGHPGGTSPLGLRNIGFAIYMGGRDAAYKRNETAAEWKAKLGTLQQKDPEGYLHQVTIYPKKGHWMDGEDASSIDWMRKQQRDTLPTKVVWKQDGVTHMRFYWLSTESPVAGTLVIAERDASTIDLQSEDVESLSIRLNDDMVNLDQPLRVTSGERVLHEGVVNRTIATLHKTLVERGDPAAMFSGEVHVSLQ